MNKKKALLFFLFFFIISIIFLVITFIKDNKSWIGYTLFGVFIAISSVFLSLFITNDSISKYRKIELENFIKNHPELNIISFDINNSNAYIEMKDKDNIIYLSIFNRKLYMDIFDKDESKKLKYLESLEDESLKKEGFLNLMKDKKGITLDIKKLSVEEIFFKVKANL